MGRNSVTMGVAAIALAGSAARAQDAPLPAPSPTPGLTAIPGIAPSRFSIGEPTPTPMLAPPPIVVPVARPTPSAPTPLPRARASATPIANRPTPSPRAMAVPAPPPVSAAGPQTVAPEPSPPSAVEAPHAPAPMLGWLWVLLAVGGAALAFGGARWWRRRGGAEGIDAAPVAEPPRPIPPSPESPRDGSAIAADPFALTIAAARITYAAREIVLEFELRLGNLQSDAADAIRVSVAPLSASPDQDRQSAGFHATPMADPVAPPFDLAPGQGGRLSLRVALPREAVHAVDLGGRPIFVPMLLVDLRWRSGVRIRRFGADFMLGLAGQGGKIGPLRLDRPAPMALLAAIRYRAPATA